MIKIFKALTFGVIAFLSVTIMVMIITYIRCFIAGVDYHFLLVMGVAAKGGAVAGSGILLMALFSMSRSQNPRKR